MIDYILNFQFNSLLGVLLYWVPLALCVIGYSVKTWQDYAYEIQRREQCIKDKYTYFPNLTLGTVLCRIFGTVMPGINILALIFSIGGPMIKSIWGFFNTIFNMPLVRPHSPKR